ncbi:MAG: ATP synthase subunit I [Deltaproteobacteria bacterium]|jgi:hypothetical protein|nr:ATP synthase subunit I [Deltaproteobacteria bacterium]
MDPKGLIRIERMNYVIGGVLIALAAVFGNQAQALGMVCGVVLSALNFSVVRRLVAQILWGPEDGRKRVAGLFIPKMAILMFAVAGAVFFLPIDPIAFAAGFSVFLASIAIESVRFMMAPPMNPPGSSDSNNDEGVGS